MQDDSTAQMHLFSTMKLLEAKKQNWSMSKRSYWAGHIRNV